MFETILRLCDNCDKWLTMNISNSFTVAPDVTVQVSVVLLLLFFLKNSQSPFGQYVVL